MSKNNIYSFHKSVRGYLHVMRDMICQDSSASFSEDNDLFHIAIVADGHGSSICVRSEIGSKFAADIAKEELERFASYILYNRRSKIDDDELLLFHSFLQNQEMDSSFYQVFGTKERNIEELSRKLQRQEAGEETEKIEKETGNSTGKTENKVGKKDGERQVRLSFPKDKDVFIKKVARSIVYKWNKAVNEHFAANPFTEEELIRAGHYGENYRRKAKIEHAYGSTLIAALQVKNFLFLIQQGDGRCDVFFEDGTVEQPIPWDENCHENMTTSLCDFDAETGIRSCVLSLDERKVVAVYVGTDGVDNSYPDMEGTHIFYRSLSCRIVESDDDGDRSEFEQYLDIMLPEFSKRGSGDDISVAGIVDLDGIRKVMGSYEREIEMYQVANMMQRYASKKVSMTRKYRILRRKMEEAKLFLEEEEEKYKEYKRKLEEAEQKYEKAKEEFEQYDAHYSEIDEKCESFAARLRELKKEAVCADENCSLPEHGDGE